LPPYLPNKKPIYGAGPGNEARYSEHLGLMQNMGFIYLLGSPLYIPPSFFAALDQTNMVYGQGIWFCV
jgi:hypothetical protein